MNAELNFRLAKLNFRSAKLNFRLLKFNYRIVLEVLDQFPPIIMTA